MQEQADRRMKREHYGTSEDGQAVDLITMANGAGMRVAILTFGCIIAARQRPIVRAGRPIPC
jgi:hypothetical protein